MAQELKEFITAKEYADFIGKTVQYIYHLIQDGRVSAVKFRRGRMAGWLVEKPLGFDEWYETKIGNSRKGEDLDAKGRNGTYH